MFLSLARRWMSSMVLVATTTTAGGCDGPGANPKTRRPTPPPVSVAGRTEVPQRWRPRVLYLVMPDRFDNGDPSNDDAGLPDCFDPAAPTKYHGGDLAGLLRRVPYLRALGVDGLWLTPLYRQAYGKTDWCPFHGYWADFAVPDDGAVEPRMGTKRDLSRLTTSLQAAGIGLVLDMVINHPADHARIVEQKPQWFHDPQACRSHDPVTDCPFRDGAFDFAQDQPEVAEYLEALSVGWVRRVRPRGIRMDTAKHVPASYFRDRWLPRIRGQRDLFIVAEVFSGDVAELVTYLEAGFDAVLNYPLHGALVDTFARDAPASRLRDALESTDSRLHGRVVNFIDNHDVPRLATELSESLPAQEAVARYHVALTALFTAPGVPQLYYGDELGMLGGPDPDNRRDMPTWGFSVQGRSRPHPKTSLGLPQQTYALVTALTRLRHDHSALRDGSLHFVGRASPAHVVEFERVDTTERLHVVLNVGPEPTELESRGGTCRLLLATPRARPDPSDPPTRCPSSVPSNAAVVLAVAP